MIVVAGQFGISVVVSNRLWGNHFGYTGYFDVEWIDMTDIPIPVHVRPVREEVRE